MKIPAILALAVFAVLLASPLAYAQMPRAGKSFQSLWSGYGWQSVAAAAVFISLLIVSLAYLLGISFRQPQMTAWAKNELYQAFASALMLATIIGVVYFFSNLTSAASCTFASGCDYDTVCAAAIAANQPCEYHIEKAWLLVTAVQRNATVQADQLLSINMRAAALQSVGKYIDVSLGTGTLMYPWQDCGVKGTCASGAEGFGLSLFAGVAMMTDAINLMFPILFSWITSFIAQAVFLAMVRDAIFPIFLTMGLILRTFFFTRKLGGLLIAIAIGVYTMYPFMYVLLQDQYDFTVWLDNYNPWTCDCHPDPVSGVKTMLHCPVRWCSGSMVEIVIWGKPFITDLGVDPPVGRSSFDADNPHPVDFIFAFTQQLGMLMVPAVIIPLLSALVTIAFIKGLSPLLGGDVEIAGLTHLI